MIEPHKVLEVSENATQEEIKKAYRKKAKQYHPDLNPGDEAAAQKMNEVNQAYDMLMNPDKYRAQRAQQSYGGYGSHPGGQGGTYWYGGSTSGGWQYYDFEDIFGSGFGGYGQQQRQTSCNIEIEPNDTYDFRKAINEINNGRFSDAIASLSRVPEQVRRARWYYISAVANKGAGNTVLAANHIQKAVNMEPDNMTYRRMYQQFNGSANTYQRNARTYTASYGSGLSSLCCSMMLSQICCGSPCYFCFC